MTQARDLIVGAVTIPSLSGEETAVATFLRDWMSARDFEAQIDEAGNAVGVRGT
ncbi:MAG: acetyl-lysine deacetylase, partial [Deinococcus sp.]|nr:acetyl-lysine deacetylase [Deinococcus sp.]